MYPNEKDMIVVPITEKTEFKHPSLPISRMNFDYKENNGKKAFLANPKHQYRVSHYGEHDCNANNQKNRYCYGYPSLSHFMDEL